MVVRLSALRTGRLYPPGTIPGTHFCRGLIRPHGHSAAGRIMSMKNSSDIIGNRTHHLPVCRAVPAPPRAAAPRHQIYTTSCKGAAETWLQEFLTSTAYSDLFIAVERAPVPTAGNDAIKNIKMLSPMEWNPNFSPVQPLLGPYTEECEWLQNTHYKSGHTHYAFAKYKT